jgi:hypothetical protein
MSKAKDKIAKAGHVAADAAKDLGHKIAQGAEKAVDFVKEKTGMSPPEGSNVGIGGIKDHMSVIASCGKKIGVVDHVEGQAIKLTKKDSPDGQHHFLPFEWVERVDSHVHLKMNSEQAEQNWKTSAASCGCGG